MYLCVPFTPLSGDQVSTIKVTKEIISMISEINRNFLQNAQKN